jgi:predicted  nucleic acid-binding Zn-ribbon protein
MGVRERSSPLQVVGPVDVDGGVVVVKIERDSCGGCFNMIPPQRQLDISLRKKVIVCEHCGRILVDNEIENMAVEA